MQLKIRYKGHLLALKYNNNNCKSTFAQRLISSGHAMGPTEEIMGVVRTTYKSRRLDTIFIEKLVEVRK
jgi:hypothetical protein